MGTAAKLKATIVSLYALQRKDSCVMAAINAAHRELFQLTGEIFSFGSFVKVA